MSQISGPHRKSKPTPLSQSGLQDPASVCGGQQLTWLSIKVSDVLFKIIFKRYVISNLNSHGYFCFLLYVFWRTFLWVCTHNVFHAIQNTLPYFHTHKYLQYDFDILCI